MERERHVILKANSYKYENAGLGEPEPPFAVRRVRPRPAINKSTCISYKKCDNIQSLSEQSENSPVSYCRIKDD